MFSKKDCSLNLELVKLNFTTACYPGKILLATPGKIYSRKILPTLILRYIELLAF